MSAFKNSKLLSQGEVLQKQASLAAKATGKEPNPQAKEVEHGQQSYQMDPLRKLCKLLISEPDRILAKDKASLGAKTTGKKPQTTSGRSGTWATVF
jgi:hypothetical protein